MYRKTEEKRARRIVLDKRPNQMNFCVGDLPFCDLPSGNVNFILIDLYIHFY